MKMLIDERGRKYLVEGKEMQSDLGVVILEDGEETAKSHLGHTFAILDPDLVDIYEKMPRSGSFMLKKDIGLILANLGLGTGDIVLDAGAGSAALALFAGSAVGPTGRVITYEKNRAFAEIARKNIEMAGLEGVVVVRNKDVLDGFDEEDGSADAVTLDMHEAWKLADEAKRVLKKGGRTVIYTLYMEHARKAHETITWDNKQFHLCLGRCRTM
jgi:tRNA (adenine57-N1/adenine58-N1)-methyltransferase